MKRQQFDDSRDDQAAPATSVRTSYHCKANGCPNAASMAGDVCYWHWRTDPLAWGPVTHRIRSNFEEMRNHGPAVGFDPKRREALLKRMGQA